MWGRIRKSGARVANAMRTEERTGRKARTHNLFEAAAAYVSACAEDDQDIHLVLPPEVVIWVMWPT